MDQGREVRVTFYNQRTKHLLLKIIQILERGLF